MKKHVLTPLKKADLKLPESQSLNRCLNIKKWITNPYVEYFDTLMILLNGALVCWVTLPTSDDVYDPLWGLVLDICFVIFFTALTLTRVFTLGVWASPHILFDMLIVTLSMIGEVLLLGEWRHSDQYLSLIHI
eukprot:TRINITY_DN4550_c0_g2_i2.p1 TRINITY_DN4550_c0_g2~~TRINITY_DN4550_c0_g2_i2.p1  ORF type:complete len:147 (+),score=29.02 TRINITY_DN4550_c0_g2_i2:45-443(+)